MENSILLLIETLTSINLITYSIVLILLFTAYWYLSSPKNLPPGPIGLPIVGYLPFMGKCPIKTINILGKKYGSVYRLYLGSRLIIVLNDYEAIKETLVKQTDVFSGRSVDITFGIPQEYLKSFLSTEGDFWRKHRRFATAVLKACGFGKLSLEPQIMDEINHFIDAVKALNGKPADLKDLLGNSIANNISILVLGKRFEYGDPTFLRIKHLIDHIMVTNNSLSTINFFPWLRFIPGLKWFFSSMDLSNVAITITDFLRAIADDHRSNHVPGQKDHYVSAYFTEQQNRLESNKSIEDFDDQTLLNNMRNLLVAGTDTTANTLLWGILHLMLHPEIQTKVQEELDNVIGPDRNPSYNDRLRTPYTEATICEILRKANIAPHALPHRNTEECKIFEYTIPKSTFILPNLSNILEDSNLWGDPESFRPERFLTEKGEVHRPEYFIPFSTGKRQCSGEILAQVELYLYFTKMMQNFTFKMADGPAPSMEGTCGTTYSPHRFLTCAISRNA